MDADFIDTEMQHGTEVRPYFELVLLYYKEFNVSPYSITRNVWCEDPSVQVYVFAHKLTKTPDHITQLMKCQKMHTICTTK